MKIICEKHGWVSSKTRNSCPGCVENVCENCMWWGNEPEKENPVIHPFRQCMNVEFGADNNFKAGEEVRGYLQTGPKFGCIHWEAKNAG